ncbi:MAG: GGDEF domain-containing protein [Arcobacteraceae bacterium]|nr:GGDEF domain-containing protein [Arcobacteraceae bacterium]
MNNPMIKLIKTAFKDESKFKSLENVYDLYDQLQYSENLNEMASSLYDWLEDKYKVTNINFYLFDMECNKNTTILKYGEEFTLNDEFVFYFIINTHTDINAIVSFKASSLAQYDVINDDYSFIEAAFFQISPILQNGIIKKHHIEASSIDSVTDVYNRKYLIERIHKIISLSSDEEEKNITFLMIGIDHFKAVIDEFDYDIGDKVLIELAKVIHGNIKDFDIVARLTGDEFLIALLDLPASSYAIEIAQRIIEKFAQTQVVIDEKKDLVLKKTICIGISSYPQDNKKIAEVLKNADSFLYEAKNKGRSQYAVYSKDELSSIDLF